jgi:LmbE family N-acetylglucosaminyl deacetylase
MEKVLAIGAHIDDIEIGCGGTLIKHHKSGDEIFLALTKSDEDLTAPSVERIEEQKTAGKIIGVDDKHLIFFKEDMKIENMVGVLDKIQPTILYFPYEIDYHQDHLVANKVGFAVARNIKITVLRYILTSSHSFFPNYLSIININDKKKLVSCFECQMSRKPKFMEVMVSQNRFFGSLIPGDGHYAEGFMLHRMVKWD